VKSWKYQEKEEDFSKDFVMNMGYFPGNRVE